MEPYLMSGRQVLRRESVAALRLLWWEGDYDLRNTVAARVRVWMCRPQDGTIAKIREREKARFAGAVGK
jgi:hypothetical protein